ncbi:sensor histidine kinase [Leptothoe sp. PORK10 BA2]|uniref:sensor histidine kinase n=1 Tax=Leptothoe sp. PORK10 BA2 TaxID=3110254 RepID=UPI002B207C5F|nr:CHASE2 domain-containing protein [Leptothoe sp. PORK10 BA2]MEA5464076.1 CHASE2 domain-containing protein [Leptothoe sp. PORK10 BA2]
MKRLAKLHQRWSSKAFPWRQLMPGSVVLGIIVAARLLGLLQGPELKMLDTLMRWRPAETTDERILIVAITEADIQALGTYPVPDNALANLILTLEKMNPRVVGLDIYRDIAVEPGHSTLVDILQTFPNVVGIEKVFNEPPILPPPALPPEQVGFVDLPLDDDGFVRRLLLGAQAPSGTFHFSFALRLAELYLANEGMVLENGLRDPLAMRFGTTEFAQITRNTGGYVNADVGDLQVLLNVRSGATPFRQVSMGDVLSGTVDPDWVNDAIVLIGVASLSAKDLINSGAVVSENPGLIYGIDIHAHATSQLVNAVLEGRPLLYTWPNGVNYVWILLWGGVGMVLVVWVKSPAWYWLLLGLTGLGIVGISYGLLVLGGWWVPLVPALLAFTVNGVVISGFYLYDQTLRSRIEERQRVIEQTYNTIHNGPLQTLALLLRDSGETVSWPEALPKLKQMDQDLRNIYEQLLDSAHISKKQHLPLAEETAGADCLLYEKLYEVYSETLQRDFPGFKTLGPHIVNFEPLKTNGLSSDNYQALCRFLEEALCNVGKHAVNATSLTVICQATETENLIQVKDNGQGLTENVFPRTTGGRGTRQAETIAQRLGGSFQRRSTPSGTCCELRWPAPSPSRPWFSWFPWP